MFSRCKVSLAWPHPLAKRRGSGLPSINDLCKWNVMTQSFCQIRACARSTDKTRGIRKLSPWTSRPTTKKRWLTSLSKLTASISLVYSSSASPRTRFSPCRICTFHDNVTSRKPRMLLIVRSAIWLEITDFRFLHKSLILGRPDPLLFARGCGHARLTRH